MKDDYNSGFISRIANSRIGRTGAVLLGVGTAAVAPTLYDMLNPPYAQEECCERKLHPDVAAFISTIMRDGRASGNIDAWYPSLYVSFRYSDSGPIGASSEDKLEIHHIHSPTGFFSAGDSGLDACVEWYEGASDAEEANKRFLDIIRALNQFYRLFSGIPD